MRSKRTIRSSAALIALLVLGASSCGSDVSSESDRRVPPSIGHSPTGYAQAPTTTPAPVAIPPCRIHQVAARFLGIGGALGHTGTFLGFANIATTRCVLQGTPRVRLVTAEDRALRLRQQKGNYFSGNDAGEQVTLSPGLPLPNRVEKLRPGQALVVFEWMACRPQPRIVRIVVSLRRGGRTLTIPVTGRGMTTSGEAMCGPDRTVKPWLAVGTFENVPLGA